MNRERTKRPAKRRLHWSPFVLELSIHYYTPAYTLLAKFRQNLSLLHSLRPALYGVANGIYKMSDKRDLAKERQ